MDSINEKYYKKTKYNSVRQSKLESFKFLNELYQQAECTVLVGDSIIEHWYYELFLDFEHQSGQTVINRGIGGDTSDRMSERLIENVVSIRPKNVAILIGTNDFDYDAPQEFTYCNIERAITTLKSSLPYTNIILISILPVNKSVLLLSSPVGRRNNEAIDELNIKLASLAAEKGIAFYNANTPLKDKKGRLDKAYTADGLHLNAQGYEKITKDLIALFK